MLTMLLKALLVMLIGAVLSAVLAVYAALWVASQCDRDARLWRRPKSKRGKVQ